MGHLKCGLDYIANVLIIDVARPAERYGLTDSTHLDCPDLVDELTSSVIRAEHGT